MSDVKGEETVGEQVKTPAYLVILAKKQFKFEWLPPYLQTVLELYDVGDVVVNFRRVTYEGMDASEGKILPDEASGNPLFKQECFHPNAVPFLYVPIEQRYQFSSGLNAVLNGTGIDLHSDAMTAVSSSHGSCFMISRKDTQTPDEDRKSPEEEIPTPTASLIPKLVISERAESILKDWITSHPEYPFPTEAQISRMSRTSNLTVEEIYSYFCRYLRRYLYERGQF